MAYKGSTIAEYSIVGGLIAVACIGSLIMFGGVIQSAFSSMAVEAYKPAPPASVIASKGYSQGTGNGANTGNSTAGQNADTSASAAASLPTDFCTSSGTCFSNPAASSNIDTSGSNGSAMSEVAVQSIMQWAEKLSAQGIPDSTIGILTNMALETHKMAEFQNQMEAEIKANGGTLPEDRAFYYWQTIYPIRQNQYASGDLYNTIKMTLPDQARWDIDGAMAVSTMSATSYNEWAGHVAKANGDTANPDDPTSYSFDPPIFDASKETQTSGNTVCSNGGDTDKCIKNGFPPS